MLYRKRAQTPPPAVSTGIFAQVPLGVADGLYREAEERRGRQARREEEAIAQAKQDCRPRLSQNSLALCQVRLERELEVAFIGAGGAGGSLPRSQVPTVLEALGLLHGEEREDDFCAKLALVLDPADTGTVSFDRLCAFLRRALGRDAKGGEPNHRYGRNYPCAGSGKSGGGALDGHPGDAVVGVSGGGCSSGGEDFHEQSSLGEECLASLERQLSSAFGRMLSHRLSRPRPPESPARASSTTVSSKPRPQSSAASSSSGQGPSFAANPSPAALMRNLATAAAAPHGGAWRCGAQTVPGPRTTPRVQQQQQQQRHATPRMRADRTAVLESPRQMRARAEWKEWRAEASELAASRCNLLYHQALLASRENAQLEEEVKALREQEEMRECTFRPKVLTARRCPSPSWGAQPRNFDQAVARLRTAHNQRVELREKLEHVPRGENYERIRRMGVKPFSFNSKGSSRRHLLMFVDVNVGRGRSGRIGVHDGDDLRVLSKNFARAFALDTQATMKLETMLRQAVDNYYDRRTQHDSEESMAPPVSPGRQARPSVPFRTADGSSERVPSWDRSTSGGAVASPARGKVPRVPLATTLSLYDAAKDAGTPSSVDSRPRHAESESRAVTVSIVGARGLPLVNGVFDVHCTCEVPGRPQMKIRTAAVSSCSDPTWDHTGPQVVLSAQESLAFCIWEGGPAAAGVERLIAEASIAAQDIGPHMQRLEAELPLRGLGGRNVGVLGVTMGIDSVFRPQRQAGWAQSEQGGYSSGESPVAKPLLQVDGDVSFQLAAANQSGTEEGIDLNVVIVGAKGVANIDGIFATNSDAYCACKVASRESVEFETRTISNCLEPAWGHTGEVRNFHSQDVLEFQVWGGSDGSPDNFLGGAALDSCHFLPHGSAETEVLLLDERQAAVGTLRVQVRTARGPNQIPLKVTMLGAKGLPEVDGYCTCSVASRSTTEIRTPVVRRCSEPTWDFSGEIVVSPDDQAIEFHVWDNRALKPECLVGSAVLAACHFLPHGGVETELLLRSEHEPVGVGSLSVRVEVSHATPRRAATPPGCIGRPRRAAWPATSQAGLA